MRILLLSFLSVLLFACGTNRYVYKSSAIQETNKQKTIAVLPLRIIQTGHVAKGVSEEQIKSMNEKWGYVFQESLHTYMLKQTGKNKKGPVADFQSPQKTNALLKEVSPSIEMLYNKTPEEIAKVLGVDAVLMTTLENDKNFSDGVAYGLAAGRAIINVVKPGIGVPSVNSSDINMNSYLYNAGDSKLLWKTYRAGGTDLPANVDGLVEYYSNWIAKKFPYKS